MQIYTWRSCGVEGGNEVHNMGKMYTDCQLNNTEHNTEKNTLGRFNEPTTRMSLEIENNEMV